MSLFEEPGEPFCRGERIQDRNRVNTFEYPLSIPSLSSLSWQDDPIPDKLDGATCRS